MAYLSAAATTTDPGLVVIGSNVGVDLNGVISIPQSVAITATPTFGALTITNDATAGGTLGVTGVATISNATASSSISTGALVVAGGIGVSGSVYAASLFDNAKRAITTVTPVAGSGITISAVTGTGPTATFTISSTGADVINTTTVTANYTATATDEYIGVNSTNVTTITLPAGVAGRVYTINDERGPGFGKITITPTGTDKINGSATYVIAVPYQSVSLVYNSSAWRII
jgi:hypothetical protein